MRAVLALVFVSNMSIKSDAWCGLRVSSWTRRGRGRDINK